MISLRELAARYVVRLSDLPVHDWAAELESFAMSANVYLTRAQAAEMVSVSTKTLDRIMKGDPTFPVVKLGERNGSVRIPLMAFRGWLDRQRITGSNAEDSLAKIS